MKKSLFTLLAALCLFSARVMAKNCVENNSLNCTQLGYTESSCPYGGVACPFDTTKWHCAKWSCEDGRYTDTADPDKDCIEVTYKGLTCYDCAEKPQCTEGFTYGINSLSDCQEDKYACTYYFNDTNVKGCGKCYQTSACQAKGSYCTRDACQVDTGKLALL